MSCLAPVLNIGVTLAIFQSDGNIPVEIDRLKINASYGAITGAAIFKTFAEIPSIPDTFEATNP